MQNVYLENDHVKFNNWKIDRNILHDKLKSWGREHYQNFPWRKERDPYRVLVAEVMLLRTRASQVERVYSSFIEEYPAIQDITTKPLMNLIHSLKSLGLIWRAERLYSLAKAIVSNYEGNIPREWDDLVALPGVSHYIAGAVRCFAWGESEALVDTNTIRIASRLFGFDVTDSSRRNKNIHMLLSTMLNSDNPRSYNFAMIDLAHQVCTSRNPFCSGCPIQLIPCRYSDNLS